MKSTKAILITYQYDRVLYKLALDSICSFGEFTRMCDGYPFLHENLLGLSLKDVRICIAIGMKGVHGVSKKGFPLRLTLFIDDGK